MSTPKAQTNVKTFLDKLIRFRAFSGPLTGMIGALSNIEEDFKLIEEKTKIFQKEAKKLMTMTKNKDLLELFTDMVKNTESSYQDLKSVAPKIATNTKKLLEQWEVLSDQLTDIQSRYLTKLEEVTEEVLRIKQLNPNL